MHAAILNFLINAQHSVELFPACPIIGVRLEDPLLIQSINTLYDLFIHPIHSKLMIVIRCRHRHQRDLE